MYDVALSFASEDRNYADKVANALKEMNISVFCDRFEKVKWGKDLYQYLQNIYFKQAKLTIMFISRYYKEKLWINHERESAQAKAFVENAEHILPARFDDTEIPGLLPAVRYINLSGLDPIYFAKMIKSKVTSSDKSVLKLVDYFPNCGQEIKMEEIENIYLKFNNSIDRNSVGLIRNFYIQANTVCKWNTGGWIEFAENDTKLIWHVKEDSLHNNDWFDSLKIDYPGFQIQIGLPNDGDKLEDVFGNKLPYIEIPVKIIE